METRGSSSLSLQILMTLPDIQKKCLQVFQGPQIVVTTQGPFGRQPP